VLEHTKYVHPLYDDRSGIVILADYVSDTNGTGLVHNAPGFGDEDYFACKVYDLHPYVPIDQYGKFTDDVKDPELVGLFYDDANKIITQRLNEKQALLKLEFINHSVAHD
jgi:isoleucyl-tRNA synthetase